MKVQYTEYSTVQYTEYSTVQYSEYSTVQYSTVHWVLYSKKSTLFVHKQQPRQYWEQSFYFLFSKQIFLVKVYIVFIKHVYSIWNVS